MKLGFSTLGCPRWGLKDIISTALDLGYDGIEIRGVENDMYAPDIKYFDGENLERTRALLKGLEIPILTSNACIALAKQTESNLTEAKDYIDLATRMSVPYVRVMCTSKPQLDGGDYTTAVKLMRELAVYGMDKGVMPLIETNGMFADTALLAKFMSEVGEKNTGVLWDVHHPYRFNGEPLRVTADNIGKRVKYVHIKDSRVEKGVTAYKMLGSGDLPISDAVETLKSIGYDGYLTLEWVKRWNPDLAEPGIVFAHYIYYMRNLLTK